MTRPDVLTFDVLLGRLPPPAVLQQKAKRAAPVSVFLPCCEIAEDKRQRREDIAQYIAANSPVTTKEIMEWAEVDFRTVGGDLKSLKMSGRIQQIGRTTKLEGSSAIWESSENGT